MQADTIHFAQRDGGRFYVYTLIDLFSRAAYAEYSPKCNQRASFHLRKSNDNAHIERFNRTIQEECLSPNIRASIVPERIYWYLAYYNQFRRHSSINGNYPLDLLDWHSC